TALSYPILGLNHHFNVLYLPPPRHSSFPSVLGCANVHTFSFSQTFFNIFLQALNNTLNISNLFFTIPILSCIIIEIFRVGFVSQQRIFGGKMESCRKKRDFSR
ncbi:MAG: hypothetical protein IKP08_00355, partial [Bacteroidales bacterium]|nr:hypothetical protein [Bacteroidales bacterium]